MHNYFNFLVEWLESEDAENGALDYLIVPLELFN